jgi:hypothetical protein
VICLSFPSWTQEEEAAGQTIDTGKTVSTDVATGIGEEDEVDDSDLDEQSYEQDDDDFVPTEEIPADEPIPFPSNI